MSSALDGWHAGSHTDEVAGKQVTHATYRKGSGPGVILIHEIPGLTAAVIGFGEELVAAGYTVVLPHLFGRVGAAATGPEVLRVLPEICVSREFTKVAMNQTTPMAGWLQSLARDLHADVGGPGIGALGMCFTGGFALAMMLEETTVAPVLCQPSTPTAIGARRGADLNLSPTDQEALVRRARSGCPVLGLRYAEDKLTGTRFDTLTELLGDQFLKVELDGPGHSTVTEQRSQVAVEAVLNFFAERLTPSSR